MTAGEKQQFSVIAEYDKVVELCYMQNTLNISKAIRKAIDEYLKNHERDEKDVD